MGKQKLIGVSGVYAILINSEVVYIGSGSNLESRKSNHLALLRKNNHKNVRLQELFDEHGEEAFSFRVLDYCSKENLFELERLHMLVHQDTIVNKNNVVDINKKVRSKPESKAISKKFSKIMRGANNPNSRISENDAKTIIELKKQGVSYKEIARDFGLSIGYISKIGVNRWKHLA